MKINVLKSIMGTVVAGLVVCGCNVSVAPTPNEVVVDEDPPAPLIEVQTVAPGPDFVWVGGEWVWGGGRWGWQAGHWDRPIHPGAVWVPGRYAYHNGHHVYVHGGWH
jgi:hypothetical protein